MTRWILGAIVVVLGAALVVWNSARGGRSVSQKEPVRYSGIDFRAHRRASVADYRGTPVLLTSWATWCVECREELPSLVTFWESRRNHGLVVIAVNVDAPDASRGIEAMVKKYSLAMPVWLDEANAYASAFGALGVPTSVLIDANGKVARTWMGRIDFQSPAVANTVDATLIR